MTDEPRTIYDARHQTATNRSYNPPNSSTRVAREFWQLLVDKKGDITLEEFTVGLTGYANAVLRERTDD